MVGGLTRGGNSGSKTSIITKPPPPTAYFTELTAQKVIFYFVALAYLLAASVIVTMQPFIDLPCTSPDPGSDRAFENPAYVDDPCRRTRFVQLLYLTVEECMFGRRIVWSVVLGSIVGWERRQADRPAGIRTMALVSLGSCLFTVNSAFAFLSGPMSWDASRVSAAIPSGVGFLGAGMIFKEANHDEETGQAIHVVHGLTTAASLWLSAAVGIACGGGLYFPASFCVAIVLVLLRFGPRQKDDEEDEEDDDPDHWGGVVEDLPSMLRDAGQSPGTLPSYRDSAPSLAEGERTPLRRDLNSSRMSQRASRRNVKAQLASII